MAKKTEQAIITAVRLQVSLAVSVGNSYIRSVHTRLRMSDIDLDCEMASDSNSCFSLHLSFCFRSWTGISINSTHFLSICKSRCPLAGSLGYYYFT
jgi:hypothetical protein